MKRVKYENVVDGHSGGKNPETLLRLRDQRKTMNFEGSLVGIPEIGAETCLGESDFVIEARRPDGNNFAILEDCLDENSFAILERHPDGKSSLILEDCLGWRNSGILLNHHDEKGSLNVVDSPAKTNSATFVGSLDGKTFELAENRHDCRETISTSDLVFHLDQQDQDPETNKQR